MHLRWYKGYFLFLNDKVKFSNSLNHPIWQSAQGGGRRNDWATGWQRDWEFERLNVTSCETLFPVSNLSNNAETTASNLINLITVDCLWFFHPRISRISRNGWRPLIFVHIRNPKKIWTLTWTNQLSRWARVTSSALFLTFFLKFCKYKHKISFFERI